MSSVTFLRAPAAAQRSRGSLSTDARTWLLPGAVLELNVGGGRCPPPANRGAKGAEWRFY